MCHFKCHMYKSKIIGLCEQDGPLPETPQPLQQQKINVLWTVFQDVGIGDVQENIVHYGSFFLHKLLHVIHFHHSIWSNCLSFLENRSIFLISKNSCIVYHHCIRFLFFRFFFCTKLVKIAPWVVLSAPAPLQFSSNPRPLPVRQRCDPPRSEDRTSAQ